MAIEIAQELTNDPAYAKHHQARQSVSISSFHLIDDTDVAGTIPYTKSGSYTLLLRSRDRSPYLGSDDYDNWLIVYFNADRHDRFWWEINREGSMNIDRVKTA